MEDKGDSEMWPLGEIKKLLRILQITHCISTNSQSKGTCKALAIEQSIY
jgi:hypothetical protein